MKHTKKNLSDSQIEFKIAVDAKDVAKHHAAAVKKLSRDVKVSGFRAGHVPAEVAETYRSCIWLTEANKPQQLMRPWSS